MKQVLVTGGGGFLGGAIVKLLLQRGVSVRSFSRSPHADLQAAGVDHVCGDLAQPKAVAAAVAGCDVVFHVAAKAGVWGAYQDFYQANVIGTKNIIDACRQHAVSRLVYTSSPSVVFDGHDMEGVDESAPYPTHYHAPYPQTKAEAERLLLAANDVELATVALRPHLIWGPGDQHLVPRILDRGRKKALRIIGDTTCLVDTIYIDNAAEAHVLAAEHLNIGSCVAGKSYFLSNGEPIPLWDMVNRILAAGALPPVQKRISPSVAYAVGAALEAIYHTLRIKSEPRMTRFMAKELSTAHWFNINAARRDFGYEPKISIDEGMLRLQAWLKSSSGDESGT